MIEKCYLLADCLFCQRVGREDWQLSRGGQTRGSRAAALLDLLFKEQTRQRRDFSHIKLLRTRKVAVEKRLLRELC